MLPAWWDKRVVFWGRLAALALFLAMMFVIKIGIRETWNALGDFAPYAFAPPLIALMIWGFWYERRYGGPSSNSVDRTD
jgi:hypothetical protein